MTARDNFEGHCCFIPWILGSQSCEEAFRLVRSMSGVFSTVINFGILGLLRRLHRLDIQSRLQAESEKTGITYPDQKYQISKVTKETRITSYQEYSNAAIYESVKKAEKRAKLSIETFGMKPLLEEKKLWDISLKEQNNLLEDSDTEDDDGEYDDDDCPDESTVAVVTQETIMENASEIEEDVKNLSKNGLISSQAVSNIQQMFKRMPGLESAISIFCAKEKTNKGTEKDIKKGNHSPFVEVKISNINFKDPIYVRKSTAVWLFQEGERVSSDRLLRVRSNQLFSSVTAKGANHQDKSTVHDGLPDVNSKVEIGELCVFRYSTSTESQWKIGKIQKFSKFKCKRLKDQEYKATFAEIKMKDIGVLCIWLLRSESSLSEYNMDPCPQTHGHYNKSNDHVYIPISDYVCTLNRDCFDVIGKNTFQSQCSGVKITNVSKDKTEMMEAAHIKLTEKCLSFIYDAIKPHRQVMPGIISRHCKSEPICIAEENTVDNPCSSDAWITVGNVTLKHSDKEILLDANGKLNDKNINCGQQLIKQLFPNIGGLQSTLLQQKRIIPLLLKALKVVYLPGHWIAVSTINAEKEDIVVYDSLYSTLHEKTKILLAQLVHTNNPHFLAQIANVTKQSGGSECGLYALAYVTHLAFGLDPSLFVFSSELMRSHLVSCIENREIQPFPTIRERRQFTGTSIVVINVYCHCRCPDTGSKMVYCDGNCGRWYHFECLSPAAQVMALKKQKWYCCDCS